VAAANKTFILLWLFLALFGPAALAGAVDIPMSNLRSCVITETMDSGGYTYIGCLENGAEIWVATMQTRLQIGEQIWFPDTPPMVNFESKSLRRKFSRLMFVPGVSRKGDLPQGETPRNRQVYSKPSPQYEEEGLYTGADDSGALVFTDDPSKVAKSASVQRRTRKVQNETVLENFSATEKKLILIQEKALNAYCSFDLNSLQSITTASYWPTLRDGLDNEGNGAAAFLREFCFAEFTVEKIRQYKDRSTFDGLNYSFAEMNFAAKRIMDKEGREQELTCKATFIKEKPGWKYVDIFCGGSSVM
jgi:hypothetical protein